MKQVLETISIIGASGFIGRHLVDRLARVSMFRVKVLLRAGLNKQDRVFGAGIEVIFGDLERPESLLGFLEPGCTVVNLVYLWGAGEAANLTLTRQLIDACDAARVGRLIHCSTAAVVGRVPDMWVNENVRCQPVTEYGITKLKIEQAFQEAAKGRFDLAILRPTSVFGPEGDPLKKLARDLVGGKRVFNYLKSCLFGKRRMNLIHVENVVAAIEFLVRHDENCCGQIFNVSDDDDEANNFSDVEAVLMDVFDLRDYRNSNLNLPLEFLTLLLWLMGRNNVNPKCNYDVDKLLKLGFVRPVTLMEGLKNYGRWYRSAHHSQSEQQAG
jgi:nucleoside-diphosphate-sugar epimerase